MASSPSFSKIQRIGDRNLQQLDDQPDDFARGEVLSSLLAALFRETPEQLLVDVPISSPESWSAPSASSLYWFRIGASRWLFTIYRNLRRVNPHRLPAASGPARHAMPADTFPQLVDGQ